MKPAPPVTSTRFLKLYFRIRLFLSCVAENASKAQGDAKASRRRAEARSRQKSSNNLGNPGSLPRRAEISNASRRPASLRPRFPRPRPLAITGPEEEPRGELD